MKTVEELEAEVASLKDTVAYYVDRCTELRVERARSLLQPNDTADEGEPGKGADAPQSDSSLTVQLLGDLASDGYPVVLTLNFPVAGTSLKMEEKILPGGSDGVVILRFPPSLYHGHADLTVVAPE